MSTLRFALGFLIFSFAATGFGSPAEDLASPSQAKRDAAAKLVRDSWMPPARTNWDSLLGALTNGMPRTNVLELLRPFKVTPEGGGGDGTTSIQSYRLDDLWRLDCSYHEGG